MKHTVSYDTLNVYYYTYSKKNLKLITDIIKKSVNVQSRTPSNIPAENLISRINVKKAKPQSVRSVKIGY